MDTKQQVYVALLQILDCIMHRIVIPMTDCDTDLLDV